MGYTYLVLLLVISAPRLVQVEGARAQLEGASSVCHFNARQLLNRERRMLYRVHGSF